MKKNCLLLFFTFFLRYFSFGQNGGFEDHAIYIRTWDTASVVLNYSQTSLSPPIGINAVFSQFGVTSVNRPFLELGTTRAQHIYKIYHQQGSTQDFLSALGAFSFIQYSELVPLPEVFTLPNDPNLPFHLDLMKAFQAFDISNGNISQYKTTVAIVDNAILTTHEDLQANMISGRDVADNDDDPNPPFSGTNAVSPNNKFRHGTTVAGAAGAVTNNGIGIASIGWNINIMPVKCTKNNSVDALSLPFAYQGVVWAAANGAEVINCSWGSPHPSNSEYEILLDIGNMGIKIIAAAGNNNLTQPVFPAAYGEGTTGWDSNNSSLVIAVGSIDANNKRSSFSNYGHWVDIVTYGGGILTTSAGSKSNGTPLNDVYSTESGTSMAAPIVSGLLGLMKAYQPNAQISELVACLINSSNSDIYTPALQPQNIPGTLGAGRVDAFAALGCLSGCSFPTATISTQGGGLLCPSGQIQLSANVGIGYSWSTGETTQDIVVTSSDIYTVTVTLTGGCTASKTMHVLFPSANPYIVITESSGAIPDDGNVCGEDEFTLTAVWGTSYEWLGTIYTQQQLRIVPSLGYLPLPQSDVFTVKIGDLYGCPGLVGTASVTINRNPVPSNGMIEVTESSGNINDGLICNGENVTLSASGGTTYLWDTGATTSSITVVPTETTTYLVKISNEYGCFVELSQTITVSSCQSSPYVSCAQCPASNKFLNIVASSSGTLYSSIPNIPSELKEYNCISISGKLIIDVDLEIDGSNFFNTKIFMSAGSEIIIGNGSNSYPTVKISRCSISGCVEMWRGITVSPFSKLIFTGNEIGDAEYAITALASPVGFPIAPTRIEVTNNGFKFNHVGIYFPRNINVGTVWHYPIDRNVFTCAAFGVTLLPPISSTLKNYDHNYGFAGIYAEGTMSSLSVGTPGAFGYSNYFARLRNGVISERDWVKIERCDFNEMVGYTGTNGVISLTNGQPKGIGVLCNSGISSVVGSHFNRCGHGIYANNAFLSVDKNKIVSTNVALQANSPVSLGINTQEVIQFTNYGFLIKDIVFNKGLTFQRYTINDNKLNSISQIFEENSVESAIMVTNAQDPEITANYSKILDNEVDVLTGVDGIRVSNQSNWEIYQNEIKHSNISSGIFIENCKNTYLFDNGTDGSLPILQNPFLPNVSPIVNRSFRITNSSGTEFCCNRSFRTHFGIDFFGPCEETVLKTTEMKNNYYNFRCSQATLLGDQPDQNSDPNGNHGNFFLDQNGIIGFGRHEGSNAYLTDSEFFVTTSTPPDHPLALQTPNASVNWFTVNSNYQPDQCDDCIIPTNPFIKTPKVYDFDKHFVDGHYANADFGSMVIWEGQMSLYKKLRRHPELINTDNVIKAFYSFADNGVIKDYYNVDSLITAVNNLPEQLLENINIQYALFLRKKEIVENEKLKIFQASTKRDSFQIYHNVDSLSSLAYENYINLYHYLNVADSIKYENVNTALQVNSNLSESDIIQENIKLVNDIYLNTIAKGIYELTDEQFERINSVAIQCPLVGGKAVHRARSLFSLRSSKDFDDDDICNAITTPRNDGQNRYSLDNEIISIYPNPSSDNIKITSSLFDNDIPCSIKIYNSSGNAIISKNVTSSKGGVDINISNMKNGLYICVINQGGTLFSRKFVINR